MTIKFLGATVIAFRRSTAPERREAAILGFLRVLPAARDRLQR